MTRPAGALTELIRVLKVSGAIDAGEGEAVGASEGSLNGAWIAPAGITGRRRGAPPEASARSGRGAAYLNAREAVTAAKNSPWHLRVVGDSPWARRLETTLWLWAAVLARRTSRGWEVADLAAEGLPYDEIARRLGISPSAVSQRAAAAGIVESRRARELATDLTACLLGKETADVG